MSGPGSPYGGTLDQVLTVLKNVALSPAMATEIASYKASLTLTEPVVIPITDADGGTVPVNLSPDPAIDLGYIADSVGAVFMAQQEKLLGPWPVLELVGMVGRVQTSVAAGERFITDIAEGEVYSIDATAWSSGEDAKHTQLEAIALAYCFKSLIRRNERLGGLVSLIQPLGPVEAMAGGKYQNSLLAGSRVRFEALVLLP